MHKGAWSCTACSKLATAGAGGPADGAAVRAAVGASGNSVDSAQILAASVALYRHACRPAHSLEGARLLKLWKSRKPMCMASVTSSQIVEQRKGMKVVQANRPRASRFPN
eukprot:1157852-Pelagomonas_calceolata.AAC.5